MDTVVKRPRIHLRYPCYICGDSYAKGPATINHIVGVHRHKLPSRRPGYKRPINPLYVYKIEGDEKYDETHHGCCSCWFHSKNYEELQEHVEREHGPNKDNFVEKEKSNYFHDTTNRSTRRISFEDDDDIDGIPPYDQAVAKTIAQQIVDLGSMLSKILKM